MFSCAEYGCGRDMCRARDICRAILPIAHCMQSGIVAVTAVHMSFKRRRNIKRIFLDVRTTFPTSIGIKISCITAAVIDENALSFFWTQFALLYYWVLLGYDVVGFANLTSYWEDSTLIEKYIPVLNSTEKSTNKRENYVSYLREDLTSIKKETSSS